MAFEMPASVAPADSSSEAPAPKAISFRELSRRQLIIELTLRLVAVMVYGVTITVMLSNWWEGERSSSLLALTLTELITLALIVCARPATHRNATPLFMAAVTYTSFFLVFLDRGPTHQWISDWLATGVQLLGLALSLWAKFALGRSYGILPAHRSLVTQGPYAHIRHPMYLGYLMQNIAFLLANASWRNLLVISVLIGTQFLRIWAEERVLHADDESGFDTYVARVPYRLIPRIY